MRFSRPSTGTILGGIALFVALGGTAAAATGTLVNIGDPTNSADVAHVTSAGRLETAGSDSVTNTVSTELATPSAYINSSVASVIGDSSCVEVAAPPSGKAMIVRDVIFNVVQDPSPGVGQHIVIFPDANCSGSAVADVNPATIGEITLPFDPGLGIRAGSGLSAVAQGSVGAELYLEGYAVPSSQVPATRVTTLGSRTPQQRG
jgi:hypothetical protein